MNNCSLFSPALPELTIPAAVVAAGDIPAAGNQDILDTLLVGDTRPVVPEQDMVGSRRAALAGTLDSWKNLEG